MAKLHPVKGVRTPHAIRLPRRQLERLLIEAATIAASPPRRLTSSSPRRLPEELRHSLEETEEHLRRLLARLDREATVLAPQHPHPRE